MTTTELHPNQLTATGAIRKFILGGAAKFTLVNKESGNRLTFRVRSAAADRDQNWSTNNQNRDLFFVSLLTGGDNESSFEYLGTLRRMEDFNGSDYYKYQHGRKSRIGKDAPSNKAFTRMWERIEDFANFPPSIEFWHEGQCCRCGRTLTVPSSIEAGIGPECAGKD